MPQTITGALSGHSYTIPELTDSAHVVTAFEDFANTIPAYPQVRMDVAHVTADVPAASVQKVYFVETAAPSTVTLPDVGLADGDRVVVYQLGDGIVSFLPGATPVGGGIPNTGSKYNSCTATYLGGKWYFAPFGYSGTLPSDSIGGDEIVDAVDPSDGKTYRYHIFRTVGPALFTSALRGQTVEVLTVGGGSDGETSSYTAAGLGGDGADLTEGSVTANYYDIYTLEVGGKDSPSHINLPSGKVTADGGTGVRAPGDDELPLSLRPGWASVLKISDVCGSGADGVGPVDGSTFGAGGGGGFKLKEPYKQQSYTHTWTTGGAYDYDCSYGARGEQYQSGTNNITGDQRPCNPCPGHAVICHGPCQCNFAWHDSSGRAHWGERGQMGCPGGWHVCGCNCCTSQPVYSTRYHCDSGGSLSGSTCHKTCRGDNTQHHSETRWTDCVSGMAPDADRNCKDTRPEGKGSGKTGVVVVRYELTTPPAGNFRSLNVAGLPGIPTIY